MIPRLSHEEFNDRETGNGKRETSLEGNLMNGKYDHEVGGCRNALQVD